MKKVFLSLSLVAILALPSVSFGQNVADLQTRIAELTKLIQQLQAQLLTIQSGGSQWCHTFNTNLRIGDSGSEVDALKTALAKENLGALANQSEFNEEMASLVSGFQEKYRSEILTPNRLQRGTGYVGPSTRKKLNQLYGCGGNIVQPQAIKVISPNGGERWYQDNIYTISWSGGKGRIGVELIDISGAHRGWITNDVTLMSSISWKSDYVFEYGPTVQIPVSPGSYKVRVGTLDELNLCGSAIKYPCRFITSDISDNPFTLLPAEKPIKITSPAVGAKYSYSGFDLKWEIAPGAKEQIKNVLIYAYSDHSFCYSYHFDTPGLPDKSENTPCGKDVRLLKYAIPAESGIYHVNINPGCTPEMKVWLRVEDEYGKFPPDTLGPVLLEGGACGPG